MPASENTLTMESTVKSAWPGTASKWIGLFVILGLGLMPVYLFESGWFQIVDPFFVVLIVISFFLSSVHERIKDHILLLLPFIIWTVIINIGYYLTYGSSVNVMLFFTMMYVFFILFCFTTIFAELLKKNGLKIIYIGLVLACIAIFTTTGHRVWEGARFSYSFNNPNQLGIYSIFLYSTILLLMQYQIDYNINDKIYYVFDVIILIISQYLLWKSLSRAALAASAILHIALIRKLFSKPTVVPVAVVVSFVMIYLLFINPTFIEDRLAARHPESVGEGFVERRIDTAVIHPMRNLKGVKILIGTGALFVEERVKGHMVTKKLFAEVHSLFGHVIWVYGLIGILLFLPWIIKSIWEDRILKDGLFIWAAFFAFSVGGVVIRARAFWIIQGLMLALVALKLENRKEPYSSDSVGELRREHQLPG
jgi:hypothetical protein